MINTFASPPDRLSAPGLAHRRLARVEEAWLLRQVGIRRPVLWLRPQICRRACSHGVLALSVACDARLRGKLVAATDAWPWASDSVPCVVLQHVADGAPWTAQVLSEAARVLAPEGRLYVLRYGRTSPWYWRYARRILVRQGAGSVVWPLDPMWLRRYRLSLEFRHALGPRGFRADVHSTAPGVEIGSRERYPLASAFRATRIWVFRKRSERPVLTPTRDRAASARGNYNLIPARREGVGSQ